MLAALSRWGSYSIGSGIARKTPMGTRLPQNFVRVRLSIEKITKIRETNMTSRLEAYRVLAYNTAKLSENKMHDDTVARRFGFSGGLVPGVDRMVYMVHLPVREWGRPVLEPGVVDAAFFKTVYE